MVSGRFVAVSLQGQGGGSVPPLCHLEICHHLHDLAVVDAGRIPADAILSLAQHPSDLTVSHATNELLPGGFILSTILYTCLSSIVEELVILNPESNIPGFVICPTVVVECHGLGLFGMLLVYRVSGRSAPLSVPPWQLSQHPGSGLSG